MLGPFRRLQRTKHGINRIGYGCFIGYLRSQSSYPRRISCFPFSTGWELLATTTRHTNLDSQNRNAGDPEVTNQCRGPSAIPRTPHLVSHLGPQRFGFRTPNLYGVLVLLSKATGKRREIEPYSKDWVWIRRIGFSRRRYPMTKPHQIRIVPCYERYRASHVRAAAIRTRTRAAQLPLQHITACKDQASGAPPRPHGPRRRALRGNMRFSNELRPRLRCHS